MHGRQIGKKQQIKSYDAGDDDDDVDGDGDGDGDGDDDDEVRQGKAAGSCLVLLSATNCKAA